MLCSYLKIGTTFPWSEPNYGASTAHIFYQNFGVRYELWILHTKTFISFDTDIIKTILTLSQNNTDK